MCEAVKCFAFRCFSVLIGWLSLFFLACLALAIFVQQVPFWRYLQFFCNRDHIPIKKKVVIDFWNFVTVTVIVIFLSVWFLSTYLSIQPKFYSVSENGKIAEVHIFCKSFSFLPHLVYKLRNFPIISYLE